MTDDAIVPMPPSEALEVIARAIHEDYLASLAERDPAVPSHADWDQLDERTRDLNRNQARDNVRKLWEQGIEVVVEVPPDAEVVEVLDDGAVEEMAKEEHRRWMAHRKAHGYEYGPVRSDDPADLRHPDIVPWSELSEEVRDKDRRPIRAFPGHLRAAGLAMVRR
ncbi:MAG: RyR domain-containing protein [Acidimicrobiales bacterium]